MPNSISSNPECGLGLLADYAAEVQAREAPIAAQPLFTPLVP